ncbi:hypothetical protein ACFQY5_12315 [Paeniroseomonas aquatica]|uniref:hypothetical protein n=1 Tax=Paeniroseomonas aquatica TaxID=373043 RepID=UPI003623833D
MKIEKAERPDPKPESKAETKAAAEALRKPGSRKGREHPIRGIPVSPGIAIGPVFDTTEEPTEAPAAASRPTGSRPRSSAWPRPPPSRASSSAS